jgi:hypothetical protein
MVSSMGEFVTVTAFRTDAAAAVVDAVSQFFSSYGWPAGRVEDAGPLTGDDVAVYSAANGWTVVVWPGYFSELVAAEFVSREVGVLASTVRIHDGDYWSHSLLRDGVFLDRFATMPDYFTDDPEQITRLKAKFAGQPSLVAEAVGRPVEQIAPYLVHVVLEDDDDDDDDDGYVPEPEVRKAFPDDEFDLDSAWVFVDFWRRLGILYPEWGAPHEARLRLAPGWSGKLPAGDAEL